MFSLLDVVVDGNDIRCREMHQLSETSLGKSWKRGFLRLELKLNLWNFRLFLLFSRFSWRPVLLQWQALFVSSSLGKWKVDCFIEKVLKWHYFCFKFDDTLQSFFVLSQFDGESFDWPKTGAEIERQKETFIRFCDIFLDLIAKAAWNGILFACQRDYPDVVLNGMARLWREVTLIRLRVKSHQHFSRVGVNGCETFFWGKRFFSHLSIEKRKTFSSQWWMIPKAICKCLLVGHASADNSLVLAVSELMHNGTVFAAATREHTKSRSYWSVMYTSQIYRCCWRMHHFQKLKSTVAMSSSVFR